MISSTSNREGLAQENARLRGDLLTLARRISHDLRTPLGGIINSAEALKEVLEEHNDSSNLAESLIHSAEEMSRLIHRTSFLAKATANPPARQTVAMGDVVAGVLQQLESRILKKQAVITTPASWPEVQGVDTWLEVVWWNLLANALQHGGQKIELGWRAEDKKLRFYVSDNGNGVPQGRQEKLFQPFSSLHETNSTRGLGLSIVQRLIELLGGECGYEPKATGGSFYFTLPA